MTIQMKDVIELVELVRSLRVDSPRITDDWVDGYVQGQHTALDTAVDRMEAFVADVTSREHHLSAYLNWQCHCHAQPTPIKIEVIV